MSEITVELPDGSERRLEEGATALDLAAAIGKRLAKDALAAESTAHLPTSRRRSPTATKWRS